MTNKMNQSLYFTLALREKCPYFGVFSGPYFIAFRLNRERYGVYGVTGYLSVFSPNAGKYRPEKLQIRTFFTQCRSLHYAMTLIYVKLELNNEKDKLA